MVRSALPDVFASDLIPYIHKLLLDLHAHPYPTIPSTPINPRRASVAVIIRIQPHFHHWPEQQLYFDGSKFKSTEDKLNAFFQLDWVKHGDPELIFIKRAANINDAWTGHVAFPGGKRDAEDLDDRATAVREAWEEIGIDLREESGRAIHCGNLTQTAITASFGSKAVMTFCPFVFLLTNPVPPLRLQPTEVASAHWVPLRSLLDPKNQTYWLEDSSAMSSRQSFGLKRMFHRMVTGRTIFTAIRLLPSETNIASEGREYAVARTAVQPLGSNVTVPLVFAHQRIPKVEDRSTKLLLWGLSLTVVSDFVDMLTPEDTIRSWSYPSFTRLDLRLWLWLLSYRYRQQVEARLREKVKQRGILALKGDDMTIIVNGESRYYGRMRVMATGRRGIWQFSLLPPYFKIIKTAAMITLYVRVVLAIILGMLIVRYFRG